MGLRLPRGRPSFHLWVPRGDQSPEFIAKPRLTRTTSLLVAMAEQRPWSGHLSLLQRGNKRTALDAAVFVVATCDLEELSDARLVLPLQFISQHRKLSGKIARSSRPAVSAVTGLRSRPCQRKQPWPLSSLAFPLPCRTQLGSRPTCAVSLWGLHCGLKSLAGFRAQCTLWLLVCIDDCSNGDLKLVVVHSTDFAQG
jgi:hypothetical protein